MSDIDHVIRSLGTVLYQIREAAGMSRETLQMKSGIHRNTIASYENGKAIPTLRTLVVLADALGYEIKVRFVRKEVESNASDK